MTHWGGGGWKILAVNFTAANVPLENCLNSVSRILDSMSHEAHLLLLLFLLPFEVKVHEEHLGHAEHPDRGPLLTTGSMERAKLAMPVTDGAKASLFLQSFSLVLILKTRHGNPTEILFYLKRTHIHIPGETTVWAKRHRMF